MSHQPVGVGELTSKFLKRSIRAEVLLKLKFFVYDSGTDRPFEITRK